MSIEIGHGSLIDQELIDDLKTLIGSYKPYNYSDINYILVKLIQLRPLGEWPDHHRFSSCFERSLPLFLFDWSNLRVLFEF